MSELVFTTPSGRSRRGAKKNCEYCDKPFVTAEASIKSGQRFCSVVCGSRNRALGHQIEVTCEQCGKKEIIRKSRLKKGTRRYCSNSCSNKGRIRKGVSLNAVARPKEEVKKARAHYYARRIYRYNHGEPRCEWKVWWIFRCRSTNKIHIHHLSHNRADNRPENLIAWCEKHHMLYHSKNRK